MSICSDFHHRGEVDLPVWARQFHYLYWQIRVEGRNKTKRRRCYRHVKQLKLELIESGQDVDLVNAVCKYLSNHRVTQAENVRFLLDNPSKQLRLF